MSLPVVIDPQIILVHKWFEDLTRLVPTRNFLKPVSHLAGATRRTEPTQRKSTNGCSRSCTRLLMRQRASLAVTFDGRAGFSARYSDALQVDFHCGRHWEQPDPGGSGG